MSTLRISNIEAKADVSSPTVDEKLKFTNSIGNTVFRIDGKNAGITTIGINTTASTITVNDNQRATFVGEVASTKFIGPFEATSGTVNGNLTVTGVLSYQDVTNVDSIGIITARKDVRVGGNLNAVGITTLTGPVAFGDTATFGDHDKIKLGDSGDLIIYHDASNSIMSNTTGELLIDSDIMNIRSKTGGESYFYGSVGAGITLFYDNSEKLRTTNTGTVTTGISTADQFKLDDVSMSISDTAVDIFVYDTRKDSDGGAWRKRTSHTSWYNETLGTATRGTRKEFPAVAVIVTESTKVTIYDGDDPDLPMWMVFLSGPNSSNERLLRYATNNASEMLNAILCVSTDDTLAYISFIDEYHNLYHTGSSYYFPERTGIVDRNILIGEPQQISGSYGVASSNTNDVAMTVLPNAPIDSATGLPVPTIAVATIGGVSVIKPDGPNDISVVDFTAQYSVNNQYGLIDFLKDNRIISTSRDKTYPTVFSIPSSDKSSFTSDDIIFSANLSDSSSGADIHGKNFTSFADITNYGEDIAMGGTGLRIANIDEVSGDDTALVADIRSDYNTGWMYGDIKGAWLADTDDTNVTADSELITNGTFSSDTSGWTAGNSTLSHGSNQMTITRSGGSGTTCYQDVTTVVGKKYMVSAKINSSGSRGDLRVHSASNWGGSLILNLAGTNGQTVGVFGSFTATSTTTMIGFTVDNDGTAITVDDVSMIAVKEEDRSKNNKGLQVFGTIQKDYVANGSDIVAYHGVNGSNYLRQPHNPDLNFGTGDFSIFVWVKKNTLSTNHYILDRAQTSPSWDSTNRSYFIINSTGYHRFRLGGTGSGGSEVSGTAKPMKEGVFNHIGFVRRSGTMEFWLNGEHTETITGSDASASFDNGGTGMSATINRFGNGFAVDYTFDRMALFRIAGTAPSPEQIKKMYHDEKKLFLPNAKCTLYGSSDAVTALAHDDATDTLHVGTSAGRSEFVGLNRINNTTTAVTTAISASNGLVAEQ